jgi:hypothetical protein
MTISPHLDLRKISAERSQFRAYPICTAPASQAARRGQAAGIDCSNKGAS